VRFISSSSRLDGEIFNMHVLRSVFECGIIKNCADQFHSL
jgi:hypothetical protein